MSSGSLTTYPSKQDKQTFCLPKSCEKITDSSKDLNQVSVCESDINEPRKSIPVTRSSSNNPEDFFKPSLVFCCFYFIIKVFRYIVIVFIYRCNKENYAANSSSDLSTTLTVSSTSISDDSSYFSDNSRNQTLKNSPPVPLAKSTIDMYDYGTRQRKSYESSSGLVEKMNIKNKVEISFNSFN